MKNKRVDIKAILKDPAKRAKLVDGMTRALINVGRDGTHVPKEHK
jgi:hypothetical protein